MRLPFSLLAPWLQLKLLRAEVQPQTPGFVSFPTFCVGMFILHNVNVMYSIFRVVGG